MKNNKILRILPLIVIAVFAFFSCNVENAKNEAILEKAIRVKDEADKAPKPQETESIELTDDALSAAFASNSPYFEASYDSDDIIWNFKNDGTLTVVDTEGRVSPYTYIIDYMSSGKYITFFFAKETRKYRVKEKNSESFTLVYVNNGGNDSGNFVFTRDSFAEAFFAGKPHFKGKYLSDGSVWNFNDDGTMLIYGPNGEVFDNYEYALIYDQTVMETYLDFYSVSQQTDSPVVTRLRINVFNALSVDMIKIVDGEPQGDPIIFVK